MEHTEGPWESTGSVVRRAAGTFVPIADTYVSAKNYSPSFKTQNANAEFIVRACNAFADIEEGVSLIVRKDHYYQLEAQAKSQPALLNACEKTCFVCPRLITKDCETCIVRKAIDKANKET